MTQDQASEHRRFLRFDLSEDVRAIDDQGCDIGRVEKVGAGGLQIRLSDAARSQKYTKGFQFGINVLESGSTQQYFKVEVRVREGDLLGVQFLNQDSSRA
jgi:hypothetical protein